MFLSFITSFFNLVTIDNYCNERAARSSKLSLHSTGKITACMFGKIFGRTIPSTSSFFLPPKAAYQPCNEYINNC